MSCVGAGRYQQKILNENGYAKTVELTGCALSQEEGRIACQSMQRPTTCAGMDPTWWWISRSARASWCAPTPKCQPDEEAWVTPIWMTRQQ
jgi:hypothetical protein